ncbi:MAG: hypothetical protein ABIS51_23250 [Sphingomonas sp.]
MTHCQSPGLHTKIPVAECAGWFYDTDRATHRADAAIAGNPMGQYRHVPSSQFAIGAFNGVPGIAEIIALGRVRRQPEAAMEAQIEVLLASNLDDPLFDAQRDVRVRSVACGQLDLLTVGSQWQGRSRVGEMQATIISADYGLRRVESLGVGAEGRGCRRLPTRLMADARCFLLERDGGDKDVVGARRVLLPQMELVRALFGVSSRLLIELIDGLRDPTVADRGILDRRNSAVLADGTVQLFCCRKLTNEEALILAAMVADPVLMGLHDEVFQQLVVQKEYRTDQPAWPKINWPFKEPIPLTFEGRWFVREGGHRRFLVTRITEIGLRLGFCRIEVHYPGAGDEQPPGSLPPPSGRMRPSNAKLVVLSTGRAPSPSRRPSEVASAPVAIPESRGVVIEFVAKGGPPQPRMSTLGEDPRSEGEFSTAGRESGADTAIGRAEIRRVVGGDASAAVSVREEALRSTWVALCRAAVEADWVLTPYPAAGIGDLSLSDGGFDFRREGVLAGLNVSGRHVIIADERTAPHDLRSLGVLVKTMERAASWHDIRAIRDAQVAFRGHWGSKAAAVEGFAVVPVRRRGEIMADAGAYADLLRSRITDAVAKTGGHCRGTPA